MKAKEMMRKAMLLAALAGASALPMAAQAGAGGGYYLEPVYKTAGDPTSGIAYWTTNSIDDIDYDIRHSVVSSDAAVTWGEAGATNWYVVSQDVTVSARITCTGDVRLLLCDGCTLTTEAGITVSGDDHALTVYGQVGGTGELVANSAAATDAGIGGSSGAGENITINGGRVTAIGGTNAAGIGGGGSNSGHNLVINGGTVTAKSLSDTTGWGAGIGGGDGGAGYDIVINGGTVEASNYGAGAAIGGGGNGSGSNITINGGDITAVAGDNNDVYGGAGIGGGCTGSGSDILINGGTIYAQGGRCGAGIGGGYYGVARGITINGGTVTAHSGIEDSGSGWAAGIGGGDTANGLDITINGGNVTAFCEAWGAGIGGGGGGGVGKNLRINGGTVFAYAKYGANWDGESGLGSGATTVAEGVYVGRYLQVKAEDANPPTAEIAFTPGENISTQLDHLQYVKIEPTPTSEIVVKATPAPEHATLAVYTNGCLSALRPGTDDEWYGASNRAVLVVYTADEGYAFATGPKVLTYELEATTDPVVAPEPPSVQLVPVPTVAPAGEYRPTQIVNGGFEKYPWNDFKVAGSNDWIRDGLFFYSTKDGEYETNVTAVALKGTDEGWNTTDRLAWGESGGLYEIYQDDLEAWGTNVTQNTNWLQRVSDGDHTVGVVNCRGRGYHWNPKTAYGSSHLAGLGQGIFIEMNAVQRDTFYQDLSTKGGDVIRWTIKHAVREIAKEVQMISVHVGAPVTEGGEIVHPESPADLKIVADTLGAYYASGVSNVNSYAYSSAAELAGLSLVTADSLGKWYPSSGVYVVPEEQGVTRFAFKSEKYDGESESATKEGNFLDDLTFSTLVGNLKAQANLDGSVTVTGYWGDTDASKTLVICVGGKTLMLDMANVLKQNFTVTIPSETIGSATQLEVYHCDYEQAKRWVEIQHYVEVVPEEIPYAETGVYTNGAPVEKVSGKYYVLSNGTAYVVYTVTEPGYYFDGGVTVKTNALDTSKNPAEAQGDPPVVLDPIEYVAPVYVDNIASNGVAYWTTNEVYAYTIVTSAAARVTWGTVGETKWYVVTNGTFQINGGVQCAGDVRLILCDGAKLTIADVAKKSAGISTDKSGSFAVYGTPDGAGELAVTGGESAAGIGGDNKGTGSAITINGGTVTATGGSSGAGIGGGANGTGSDITINGGTVVATGAQYGAGIGGGNKGTGSVLTINGGTVVATGGKNAAGIGGGHDGSSGSAITINDGTVTATGSSGGAGIGGGTKGVGLNIAINGGTVTAAGNQGAGIGGGRSSSGTNITITAGRIWVANSGPYELIGSGKDGSVSSGVTIAEEAKVMFDVVDGGGLPGGQPLPNWEGFAILTPETPTNRVLVSGMDASGAVGVRALTWQMTNAVTAVTASIEVDGTSDSFGGAYFGLPLADMKLSLVRLTAQVFNAQGADLGACQTLDEAVQNVPENGTVRLLADQTDAYAVGVAREFTFEANGFKSGELTAHTGYLVVDGLANGVRYHRLAYHVTFDAGTGAPEGVTLPDAFDYCDRGVAWPLAKPTYSGDTAFNGWKFGDTERIANEIPAGTTGNLTLIAQWTAAQVIEVKEEKTSEEPDVEVKVTQEWINTHVDEGKREDAKEIQKVLNEADPNGNMKWQNYVMGLDTNAAVMTDAKHNDDPRILPVMPANVRAPLADTGFSVSYSLDQVTTAGAVIGEEGAATNRDSLVVHLDEVQSNAYFKINIILTRDGEDPATQGKKFIATNTLGILNVTNPPNLSIIGVPWGRLGYGDADISVSNLIDTANLTVGDKIHVYRMATKTYESWRLDENGAWEPVITVKSALNAEPKIALAANPDTATAKRGDALWLERQDASKPVYLYGQVETNEVVTTEATCGDDKWNLVASPRPEALDLDKQFGAASAGDRIIVPTGGAPKNYTFKDGHWGYSVTEPVFRKGVQVGVRAVRKTGDTMVPAGTGFWYINYGGETKEINW